MKYEILLKLSNFYIISKPIKMTDLLRRDEISCLDLRHFGMTIPDDEDIYGPVEIQVKYSGYIVRERRAIRSSEQLDRVRIPEELGYEGMGLSREVVEKLKRHLPENLGQASRISGITPAAIQILQVHISAGQARA